MQSTEDPLVDVKKKENNICAQEILRIVLQQEGNRKVTEVANQIPLLGAQVVRGCSPFFFLTRYFITFFFSTPSGLRYFSELLLSVLARNNICYDVITEQHNYRQGSPIRKTTPKKNTTPEFCHSLRKKAAAAIVAGLPFSNAIN